MAWIRVSRTKRCPICNHAEWCSVSSDGAVAICMREPSDKECQGGGWIHVINKSIGARIGNFFKKKEKRISPAEWHGMIIAYMEAMRFIDWQQITQRLGLSSIAMARYLVGRYQHSIPTYTFPMWDGFGKLCGIRLRADNGEKWSITGSKNGLFIPTMLTGESPLLICEGCTDPIAATEMMFDAIGRPSCNSGFEDIKIFLKRNHYEQVVIMSDNDEAKIRNDGSTWYPGQEGADKLCKQLTKYCNVKVVKPPVKDLRLWFNQGAKREDVLGLIR